MKKRIIFIIATLLTLGIITVAISKVNKSIKKSISQEQSFNPVISYQGIIKDAEDKNFVDGKYSVYVINKETMNYY